MTASKYKRFQAMVMLCWAAVVMAMLFILPASIYTAIFILAFAIMLIPVNIHLLYKANSTPKAAGSEIKYNIMALVAFIAAVICTLLFI